MQLEFTLVAQLDDLSGKKTVRRGGHRGFEISLDLRVVQPAAESPSKSVAILGKTSIPSSNAGARWTLAPIEPGGAQAVLSATNAFEQALELPAVRHGALTFGFLEAVRARGLSEIDEIFYSAVSSVRLATGGKQFPNYLRQGHLWQLPVDGGRFHSPEGVFCLSVGLSDYSDPLIPAPRFATRDAVAVYDWLLETGALPGNSHLLLDRLATHRNLEEHLSLFKTCYTA